MLSIFSHTCWSFLYLLWRNVSSGPLPIFKSGYLSFLLLNCRASLYILDMNSCSIHGLQIFLLFWMLPFHSVDCFLCFTDVLKLDVVQFVYFCSLSVLLVSYSRSHSKSYVLEFFPYVSSISFRVSYVFFYFYKQVEYKINWDMRYNLWLRRKSTISKIYKIFLF